MRRDYSYHFICWGIVFSALLLHGCGDAGPITRTWQGTADHQWAELPVSGTTVAGFAEIGPSRTGITFENTISDAVFLENRALLNGSGVAAGDVDGDGWADLYFCRLDGPNTLYRNLGGWRFEDITEAAGVALPAQYSTGAVFSDVDGDGDLDLLVTALRGPHRLLLNDGTGQFQESTNHGLIGGGGSTTMTLADVDADGDLDLYTARYKRRALRDSLRPDFIAFDRVVDRLDENQFEVKPEFAKHYGLEVRYGTAYRNELGEPDQFYRNEGDGRFSPVSFTEGVFLDETGQPLREAPRDWGLTARFYDVDGDGHPDIYVCNDFETPDRFWRNDGTGRFQAIAHPALRQTPNSSMALDFSDIDRDGDVDFFVGDMLSRDRVQRQRQRPSAFPLPRLIGGLDERRQVERNAMFLNRGDDTFAETSVFSGVAASDWSWGTAFLDVDLDGFEDLLIATGNWVDVQSAQAQLQQSRTPVQTFAQFKQLLLQYPRLLQQNVAFRNRGDGTFTEMDEGWGFGTAPDVTHGLALADLDHDGDLDVVTNRFRQTAGLYRNEAGAARIAVELIGQAPNTQAVGAKLTLQGKDLVQTKEITSGGMYVSGSDPLAVFAAPEANAPYRLHIRWRNGSETRIDALPVNTIHRISEPAADAVSLQKPTAPDPFFTAVSTSLQHDQVLVDDLAQQPLLPKKLSQLGPSLAWFDRDGDGDDDLLMGGHGWAVNDRGRFRQAGARMAGQHLLPWRKTNGAVGVWMGGLAYTNAAQQGLVDAATGEVLHATDAEIGAIAMADVDGDGDLDLFAGERVQRGQYPQPVSGHLFHNQGDVFTEDVVQENTWKNLGLINAATFSDLDADGDPDLLLAVEWGPIRYFENENGRFQDRTETAGFSDHTGWWQGLTTGDLNNDGRLDIIATNWGLNTLYQASPEVPIRLYHKDFDNSGTHDLIEAVFDTQAENWVPRRKFDALAEAIPFLQRRVASYVQFSTATLPDLLGSQWGSTPYVEANTLAHMAFLQQPDGTFSSQPLPAAAQLAPAFSVHIADFDGDGAEDVFITQNFFAYPAEFPRSDAGRALWLRGDGTGHLTPISGAAAGITVYGEQRGAALSDFNNDGRVDVALAQNGANIKIYENKKATQGLQIRLRGATSNPHGIGAWVRLKYADRTYGPVREIKAGSGFGAHDSVVAVLGRAQPVAAVWVRWPNGNITEQPVNPDLQTIEIIQVPV